MTKARTAGHYPAPFAALRVMEHGFGRPLERGLELEANEVSDLVIGPVCKNLVRIFLLSEAAKKTPVVPGSPAEPQPVSRLALLGAPPANRTGLTRRATPPAPR